MGASSGGPVEQWWERLPRILGGWGLVVLIFFKFPHPAEPGILSWGAFVALIVFAIGVAHSTVVGIVLGNLTKAIGNVRRIWKGKRESSAQPAIGDVGTSSVSLEGTRKREAMPDIRRPKKPRKR